MREKNVTNLFRAILSLENIEDCERLFSDLFTTREVLDISSRLEVARLLSRGVNYNDIASATGASTATISRVSKCLAGEVGGYRMILSRLFGSDEVFKIALPKGEDVDRLYDLILEKLPSAPPPTDNGEGVVRASAKDIPMLVNMGAVDFAVTTEWDIIESGLKLEPVAKLSDTRYFVLESGKELDEIKSVATSYPTLAKQFLASLGIKASVFPTENVADYHGGNLFDATLDICQRVPKDKPSLEMSYVIIASKQKEKLIKKLLA